MLVTRSLIKNVFMCFIFYSSILYCQNTVVENSKWSFIASFNGGLGLDNKDVFETTDGDMVTISAGGGGGFEFMANYNMTEALFLSGSMGYSESLLSQELSNAAGSFDRLILTTCVGYKVVLKKGRSLSFSVGPGYFSEGVLDLDGAELNEGTHNIFFYESTAGLMSRFGYEFPLKSINWFSKSWRLGVGLNTYWVNYPLKSLTVNGYKIENIGEVVVPEYKELNGSGLDISFYCSFN